ncbi:putative membrane protein [Kribbella rubisoli]|uniref:Membrane protein n=1 Tax=Kribbella rubisoli TaxID=3075929 RepID=A0A4Q7WNG1_9ACTN|nr:SHOCT domain-containing protein [Kribbella rubisoli]RZU11298.1 putative membrane protein [Kribbella rubisoli]
MMHSATGAVLWAVTVIALWGGAAWAAVHLLRRPHRRPRPALPSPLDILERRYAAGDMTREDFDEARARLREHELDI